MPIKLVHISIPEKLLRKIDQAASEQSMKRSEFIRSAVAERLNRIDEQNTRLAAVTQAADPPTEEMIFDLLKLKDRQRATARWQQEWRKEIRERSKRRKRKLH